MPALLDQLGVFGGRVLAAHGVHLSDDDIGLLAARGAAVAHCPGSNAKLAAGVARVPALRRAGVRVGLGTDGPASGDDLDLWSQARLAGLPRPGDQRGRGGADGAGAAADGDAGGGGGDRPRRPRDARAGVAGPTWCTSTWPTRRSSTRPTTASCCRTWSGRRERGWSATCGWPGSRCWRTASRPAGPRGHHPRAAGGGGAAAHVVRESRAGVYEVPSAFARVQTPWCTNHRTRAVSRPTVPGAARGRQRPGDPAPEVHAPPRGTPRAARPPSGARCGGRPPRPRRRSSHGVPVRTAVARRAPPGPRARRSRCARARSAGRASRGRAGTPRVRRDPDPAGSPRAPGIRGRRPARATSSRRVTPPVRSRGRRAAAPIRVPRGRAGRCRPSRSRRAEAGRSASGSGRESLVENGERVGRTSRAGEVGDDALEERTGRPWRSSRSAAIADPVVHDDAGPAPSCACSYGTTDGPASEEAPSARAGTRRTGRRRPRRGRGRARPP